MQRGVAIKQSNGQQRDLALKTGVGRIRMAPKPHKAKSNKVEVGQRPTRYPIYPDLLEVEDNSTKKHT